MMLFKPSALCGSNPSALLVTMACAMDAQKSLGSAVQASSSWLVPFTENIGND
jgi:hypothetical protein